jgi:hypothetical protein
MMLLNTAIYKGVERVQEPYLPQEGQERHSLSRDRTLMCPYPRIAYVG